MWPFSANLPQASAGGRQKCKAPKVSKQCAPTIGWD